MITLDQTETELIQNELDVINEYESDASQELRGVATEEYIKSMSPYEKVQDSDSELLKRAIIQSLENWDADEFKEDLLKNLEMEYSKSLNRSFNDTRMSFVTVDFHEIEFSAIEKEIKEQGNY